MKESLALSPQPLASWHLRFSSSPFKDKKIHCIKIRKFIVLTFYVDSHPKFRAELIELVCHMLNKFTPCSAWKQLFIDGYIHVRIVGLLYEGIS